jgi:hypothetical protein
MTSRVAGHTEWFRDVVLGAELETHDLVDLRAARGQHENGHRATVSPERTQDLEAVEPREHDVEDHEIDAVFTSFLEPFFSVVRQQNSVTLGGQVQLETHRDAWVVLDDENGPRPGIAVRMRHARRLLETAQAREGSAPSMAGGCSVESTRENVEPLPISLSSSTRPP